MLEMIPGRFITYVTHRPRQDEMLMPLKRGPIDLHDFSDLFPLENPLRVADEGSLYTNWVENHFSRKPSEE